MASASSIAIRREAALTAIADALGLDLTVQAKNAALKEAMVLEAIAAALVIPDPSGMPTALPDDFPGRDALLAAGHTTIDAVRAVADLTAITGIGKATAAAIAEALAALAPAPTAETGDDGQLPDVSSTATNDGDSGGADGASSTATNDGDSGGADGVSSTTTNDGAAA